MTAKNKGESPKKATAKKVAGKKGAAKKAAKKASGTRRERKKLGQHPESPFAPEVLADLAVKLVRLSLGESSESPPSAPRLANRAFDTTFADALKRAEMLLLAASGKSDEDVHAYQLFTENDGLMSFEEIAARFKEFEWDGMKARNTVEPSIKALVDAAELEIQNDRDRYEELVIARSRYAGGVYHLADRARWHIRNMINRTGLRDLFDDPRQAADMMGQYFVRLMKKQIPGEWIRNLDEELLSADRFDSFITYVCGDLNYEQFIGDLPHASMNFERLGCLVFFLEKLEREYPASQQSTRQDLGSLIRIVRFHNGVPPETINNLEDCLAALSKSEPDAAQVRQLAKDAGLTLRLMWERWYFVRLAAAQDLGNLINELNESRSDLQSSAQIPTAKIDQVLTLLRRAHEAGRLPDGSMEAVEIRQQLVELAECLEDITITEAAKVPACRFDGLIGDEMRRVACGLKKGLQMKPSTKRHMQHALADLLGELRPYYGGRRCRPYELFLFAAQKCLQPEKLVRSRSSLAPNLVPNPPNIHSSLSIIETHRGAEFAMETEEPE